MTDHCPTCGAAVCVEVSGVTHYMIPIDAERMREQRIRELEAALLNIKASSIEPHILQIVEETLEQGDG